MSKEPEKDNLNPGSKEAVDKGCKCPVMDNHNGKGVLNGNFWINKECPIHGEPEKKNHCKKCGNNIPDHFNTCEESGFGDGCGVTFREPEKKDVWEQFDEKFVNKMAHLTPNPAGGVYSGDKNELISFIKTHFIPRAEVVERVKNLEVMGIGGAFGEGYEAGYKKAKSDLLDLLTQEK